MKQKKFVIFLCSIMVIAMLSACTLFSPQKKPETEPTPPSSSQNEPEITVYMHETGQTKKMPLEDYIAGVVAGEMKADWPVEALAAQAILARTFTLQAIESKGGVPARGTQASTDIKEFQAYDAKSINDNVREAIRMSRGKVVTYQGKLITAWFHASAGGMTATAKEGLNYKDAEPPYISPVASPDEQAPPEVRNWKATVSTEAMMTALAQIGQKVNTVDAVEITQKGPSGRAEELTVNHSVKVSGPELRIALGSDVVKSMLLDTVEVSGGKVIFSGRGFGHGVGMSQWGAYALAKSGTSATDIIAHYFQGVAIEQRY
ncbi:MAG: SpoIID/LytB domain-containing protein [Sporomusaceae bacterium]|nr:SpoIID/LytB domain-containing protein [Sporomusaceae bacterium]